MSTKADALLNSMTGGNAELGDAVLGQMLLGVSAYDSEVEGHIIIDRNRFITVPEALKRIAVEDDHRIETVTFDCPRYWDEHDLSEMKIYINYIRYDKYIGSYPIDNAVTIDEDDDSIIHFDWVITREVTDVAGGLVFLVCAKKVDEYGNEENHWNSELNKDLYVSEGLEVQDIIMNEYPDLVTHLLTRMDVCEHKTTLEAMLGYLDEYFATDATINDVLLNYVEGFLTSDPNTQSAIEQAITDLVTGSLSITDKTLSVDGGVADAKVVGDHIRNESNPHGVTTTQVFGANQNPFSSVNDYYNLPYGVTEGVYASLKTNDPFKETGAKRVYALRSKGSSDTISVILAICLDGGNDSGRTFEGYISPSSTTVVWRELYSSAKNSVVPITNGGTGANNAVTARTNLGAQAKLELYHSNVDSINVSDRTVTTLYSWMSSTSGTYLVFGSAAIECTNDDAYPEMKICLSTNNSFNNAASGGTISKSGFAAQMNCWGVFTFSGKASVNLLAYHQCGGDRTATNAKITAIKLS